ncbi:hypothetical protein LNV08_05610 [Paucibacter sp. TC2R-5]|uniref:hypothetical protein n=1 Tax=Paucibacter sp. TC2R-5 TaxID=2893555 RepID=UPI0021E4C938|nr:hypothetical protein [Paucibacter sp. TC2R-5]MCV2358447.1 hypothetical protein [Paucibacter sp. TC2R-5]
MKPRPIKRPFSAPRTLATLGLGLALLSPAWAYAADPAADTGKSFVAGINVKEQARLQDIGLPAYPGAVAQQDDKDDKPGVTVGLSLGPFGFKLLVSKFSSGDSIDSISAFYREALSKHGPVLDCSYGSPAALAAKAERKKGAEQGCAEVSGDPGERVYKTGAGKSFLLVSLKQANAKDVHFQMVRMELRGF